MDGSLHEKIRGETGAALEEFDLFYTYLTMQEEFAELISERAKPGAVFMVYGLNDILPRFPGFRLLSQKPLEGIVALYRKT
jgi:tRNA(Ile2) C34 agmatinyltransferase TiaS